MTALATTKLSSKGQVIIPESVREQLGLQEGDQFVVYGEKGVVILKSLLSPSLDELGRLLKSVRTKAKKAGVTQADVDSAVARARRKK